MKPTKTLPVLLNILLIAVLSYGVISALIAGDDFWAIAYCSTGIAHLLHLISSLNPKRDKS
ncbi:MAG: hypothetical protein JAZ11_00260 [Candidatus Thiodiazotropha lotti]|nr:hypothetical protein [Candidatus Thiodiazotropha lotti]